MRTSDFRGSGWAFPILPGVDGSLQYVRGSDNIGQSMLLLLRTVAGERRMRPTFGTKVGESLFQGDSEHVLRHIEEAISDAVREWEPRVELDAVTAERSAVDEAGVEVRVEFRVLETNTKRNIVFPFYISGGGA